MAKPSLTLTTGADAFNLNSYLNGGGVNPFASGGGFYGTVDGAGGSDTFTADFSAGGQPITMSASGTTVSFKNGNYTNFQALNFEGWNITTGAGDDVLIGSAGNDVLTGGAGNDVFNIGAVSGTDTLAGGAGNDWLKASWATATNNLTVNLTAASSVVGSTTFSGFERGNITTGSGNDVVITSTTARFTDVISAGAGNDTVTAGAGNDKLDGGDGADTLILNLSSSSSGMKYVANGVSGFTGAYAGGNTIIGFKSFENYNLTGTAKADVIVTGAGNDTIAAGGGNDDITSGTGTDVIDGGGGTDAWHADFSTSTAGITVNANAAVATAVNVGGTTYMNIEILDLTGTAYADTVQFKDGVAANDRVILGAGNDTLTSVTTASNSTGIDTLDGGTGTDTLVLNWGTTGYSVSAGYSGSNYVANTAMGSATTATNFEKFNITGGSGDDSLTGGVLADTLTGGNGDDTLVSGGGIDVVDGGAGTDTFTLNVSATTSAVNFSAATTATVGTDTGTYTIGGTSAGTGSVANVEVLNVTTGSGNDVLVDTGAANKNFTAGAGDDVIHVGSGGMSVVDGGTGTDKLTIDWTNSSTALALNTQAEDQVTGATVYGDPTNASVVFKNIEIFEMHGGSANDVLVGGSLGDMLEGNGGNDQLTGGAGDDVLRGDRADGTGTYGSDTFFATQGGGTDTILDAGNGNVADYIGSSSVEFTSLAAGTGSTVTAGQVEFQVVDTATTKVFVGLDANQGADQVFVLTGDYSAAGRFSLVNGVLKVSGATVTTPGVLAGTSGNDTLTGTTGSDVMQGFDGNDAINGGTGADAITGGAGADTLTGGGGADTFKYADLGDSAPGYADTITDFVSGTDKIDLSGIDPNPVATGDQACVFNAAGAFSGVRGEIIIVGNTLQLDANADGLTDLMINLTGVTTITAADLIL